MIGIELQVDYSADDLRALARKSRNAKQARRLMALSGVADGLSRTDAAAVGLMDRQTALSEEGLVMSGWCPFGKVILLDVLAWRFGCSHVSGL